MITYDRSAFGWKLIFRAHGSAVYRSVLPSLVAVVVYFLFERSRDINGVNDVEEIDHPYTIGVLVTTSTFLIVFKLNQSYNRYWEACGNTHQFMSKWMDAATHTSIYHMQCDHYTNIRPPCFYHYPELNSLYMTRDRERMNTPFVHRRGSGSGNYENENETGMMLRNRNQTQPQISQNSVHDIAPLQRFANGSTDDPVQNEVLRGEYGRKTGSISRNVSKRRNKEEIKEEYERRASAKSINNLDKTRYRTRDMWQKNDSKGLSVSSLYSVISKSVRDKNPTKLSSKNLYEESVFHAFGSDPIPLVGKPRLDGNWTNYFTKNPKHPLCTFVDPHRPENIDSKGFASSQGDRTPPLFLQELAHLSSLLTAVALSTLRNDMEGCESPLAIYEPGQSWPEVDPNKDELTRKKGLKAFVAAAKIFFGVGLTAEQRSKHNAAQPLPVIGGVSDAEIRFLQIARGPYAKTQLCFNWLSEFIIREHLAGSLGKVAPPIVSRIFQFLGDGMIFYNHARKIMFIPFPFVHAQLSIIFVLSMVVVVPYLMHHEIREESVGAILTFLTVLCLQGTNEVARDLENPFRNFPNELPLVNFQAQFNEALITMFAGYHPDFFWDGDQVMRMAQLSGRAVTGRKQQEKGDIGLETNAPAPADGNINNVTINVKSQKPGDVTPLGSCEGETTEVAALKLQVEYQAKVIEQLYAKVNDICEKTDT
mmetsp:Transcript_17190/g.39719  ORF Transcript_17190/g.39719 Transcript_17190/m.39719 type:complete len:706 (-) Transcript_17190:69-2186(-)|eukprot:CAMPEP_0197175960 /NCGR_PEP_ID=MMETSP1423-20130617/2031_1 /TAXON_ID=476441 /ORGANISM="Pseudo-nitzschia heimii, Strain UNC1101" /LENGTH=705 /DNA_ID=CAMNT_0042625235 /DNA_START=135 /DNA_END=2255 /DNA_ORIENTATION=-